MPKLVFRAGAKQDLAKLLTFIAKSSGSPDRAINYVRRIVERCEALLTFPESGRRRDDLRPGVLIIGFEKRVVIAYKVLPSGDLEIGRVFYGGRNYERLLGKTDRT